MENIMKAEIFEKLNEMNSKLISKLEIINENQDNLSYSLQNEDMVDEEDIRTAIEDYEEEVRNALKIIQRMKLFF
jgi:hypothetical protein